MDGTGADSILVGRLRELRGTEKFDGDDGTLSAFGDVGVARDSRGALVIEALLRFTGADISGEDTAGLDTPDNGVSLDCGAEVKAFGTDISEIEGVGAPLVERAGLDISGIETSLVGIARLEEWNSLVVRDSLGICGVENSSIPCDDPDGLILMYLAVSTSGTS